MEKILSVKKISLIFLAVTLVGCVGTPDPEDTTELTGDSVFDTIEVDDIRAETKASRRVSVPPPGDQEELFSSGLDPYFAGDDWEYVYFISGTVNNIDTRPIKEIIVTVSLFDDDGNLLRSEQAFLGDLSIDGTRGFQVRFSEDNFANFEQADNYELDYTVII
jgi:hypothetical protein